MGKYIVILVLYLVIFPKIGFASEDQYISIVNPVRISSYNPTPGDSITSQYEEVSKRNLPATWLLTYDAINNGDIKKVITQMDDQQEIGIFFEVTENFTKDAGVTYNKTDSWHRANSVLTTGYLQQDRIKLIDTVFKKFKDVFGNYPTSVGAWWIDSYSLTYMKKKYGITADLTVADQFSTDGYGVWGQYFSIPFYPSKNHAGIPANSQNSKLDVVTMQWAPRDPLNSIGISEESRFSSQDYQILDLPDKYYEKLISLYSQKNRNQFGQIVLGLEADLAPETYKGLYARQLDIIKDFELKQKVSTTTMKQFSNWYRQRFPQISPAHIIESDDLLGKKKKVVWYQSPWYRIGLLYDWDLGEIKIFDFRTYHDNFQEPYYLTPNKELELYVRLPSLIDIVQNPHSFWSIPTGGEVVTNGNPEQFIVSFPSGELIFGPRLIKLDNGLVFPENLSQGSLTRYNFVDNWPYSENGLTFKDLPIQFWYFTNVENLKKPQNVRRLSVGFGILTIVFIITAVTKVYKKRKFKIVALLCLGTLTLVALLKSENYWVSQAELDTLIQLKMQSDGKVVVYNQDCLRCIYHSQFRPATFANRRSYVSKVSGKKIVYNRSIFKALDRPSGRKELDKLKAKYIYVVKYENYVEKLPFSPGDYNLDLIYENSNSQLWKIKNEF